MPRRNWRSWLQPRASRQHFQIWSFRIKRLVRGRPVRGIRGDSCLLKRILLVMVAAVVRPDVEEATVGSKQ